MSAPLRRPRMTLLRWLIAAVVLIIVAALSVVLVLHYRSRDPHTAARRPIVSGSRQVNPTIERRAQKFLAALRAGDEGQLRALAFPPSGGDVSSFVTAFGHRDDRLEVLQTSDLGGSRGELDLAVPCKGQPEQHLTVLFGWRRTSFVSSTWSAIIHPPGAEFGLPNGCAAP